MYFVYLNVNSGITQCVKKYSDLVGGKLVTPYEIIPDNQDIFVFALPIDIWINYIKKYKPKARSMHCMTICETETVHPYYKNLVELFDVIWVASEFCKKVFERQFPNTAKFKVLRLWTNNPVPNFELIPFQVPPSVKYIFYHIGNVLDPRKNMKKLIETFMRLDLPDSLFIIKATGLRPFNFKTKNICVINDFLTLGQLEHLHRMCDCYVSFSFSEGVGMGAVEAAIRNKPVIITEYGGCVEYVKTPYTIQCGRRPVGYSEFLFEPNMVWGDPDVKQLSSFMKDAYDKKLRVMNHEHTRRVMDNISHELRNINNNTKNDDT